MAARARKVKADDGAVQPSDGGRSPRRPTLEDLRAAPYNPRRISEAAAAGLGCSLESFGDISGVVWNERTGNLVCGHQRVAQLVSRGAKLARGALQLPSGERFAVRVVDWPLSREQAANVAANSPHIAGEFTDDLDAVLFDVKAAEPDLYDELLLGELETPGPVEVVEDEAPEVDESNVVTRPGDLWLCGRHRVLCGDSTKADDVAAVMGGTEPFLMVTDPPYGVAYDGGEANVKKRERLAGDESADLYEPAYALSPSTVAYCWFAGCNAMPVYAAAKRNGFEPRALLVWNKLKPHYAAASAHYKQKHEPCLYSVRHGRSAKWSGDMTVPTVWDIEQPRKNEHHPTQKPVECMARPIRNHDTSEVYDPFLGSGTTLIAAEQLGRTCYGIEISPKYVDVICKRYLQATGDSPVRDGDGKKFADLTGA